MDDQAAPPGSGDPAGSPPQARGTLPTAGSPHVRDLLAGPIRRARIEHRGSQALYLVPDPLDGGECLGVLATGAARVPCGLLTALADLGPLASATGAWVGGARVVLAGPVPTTVVVARLVDPRVPRLDRALLDFAAEHLHPVGAARAELPCAALTALAAGDPGAVTSLLGRGSGLTPLGDDVLAGWLAWHAALGPGDPAAAVARAVLTHRHRTTPLSATLLRRAVHGEVLPEFAAVVRAVISRDAAAVGRRTARLARVGHTSGAGLLDGAALALGHALTVHPRRPPEGERCA